MRNFTAWATSQLVRDLYYVELEQEGFRHTPHGRWPSFAWAIIRNPSVEVLHEVPQQALVFLLENCCLVGLVFNQREKAVEILFLQVKKEKRGTGILQRVMQLLCREADRAGFSLTAHVARYEILNQNVWKKEFWKSLDEDDDDSLERRPVENEREENLRWFNILSRRYGFELCGEDLRVSREPR